MIIEWKLCKIWKPLGDYPQAVKIQPSIFSYNHPIVFICRKKIELHVCVNYRRLNYNTIVYRYPILIIGSILDHLGHAIFRKIDLAIGYHQVEVHPNHRYYSAFQINFCLWEYFSMLLDLCYTPSIFQRLTNSLFKLCPAIPLKSL